MAGRKKRAPKSWARVLEVKAKLGRKGVTRAQIIAAVQEKYPQVVRVESADLIYLGLMSIVNSACNLKGASRLAVQPDLFKGFNLPESIALRIHDAANSDTRSIEKNFDTTTKAELRQHIADSSARPPKQSRRNSELQRFFDFIKDYGADDSTLKECWEAAQRSGSSRKQK